MIASLQQSPTRPISLNLDETSLKRRQLIRVDTEMVEMRLRMADTGLQFSAILPEDTSVSVLKEHIISNGLCNRIENGRGKERKGICTSIDLIQAGRFLENHLLLKDIVRGSCVDGKSMDIYVVSHQKQNKHQKRLFGLFTCFPCF